MSGRDGALRYVPTRGALGSFLLSDEMADCVRTVGERVADRARQIAPVDTGAYRDGITVVVDRHRTRVVAHVGSTAAHALVVESRQHVMRRALG